MTKDNINHLIKKSKEVIRSCALQNGAIVAANTDVDAYPKNVQNYRYVWPRDVSYTLYAAHLLGINDIEKPFLRWLFTRAEEFSQTGMIFQRYATNGARDTEFGYQYQPDQAGSLLWTILETKKTLDKETKKVIGLLAEGICRNWDGNHFFIQSHNLWEDKTAFSSFDDNFSYTLAACSYGLERASTKLNKNKWKKTSDEMKKQLQDIKLDYYPNSWGKLPDKRIDASVISLVWPFPVVKYDRKLIHSLQLVKERLMSDLGIKRYESDVYDCMVEHCNHLKKGAGSWPLLMFWYITVLSKLNQKDEAKKLFENYIKNFKDYIPEQLFDNDIQVSVSPLCWSHSMFVIAAKELGYF